MAVISAGSKSANGIVSNRDTSPRSRRRTGSCVVSSRTITLIALVFIVTQAILAIIFGFASTVLDAGSIIGPVELLLLSNKWDFVDANNRDDDVVAMEDHIVDQTERHLEMVEKGEPIQHERPLGRSIDDYYKRKHIPSGATPKPILVVGGSDGSGTRAFVDTLSRLGVPMLIDDKGTLDIHATGLFQGLGWPALIQTVLNETHSANYNYSSLSTKAQGRVRNEMFKFQAIYEPRADTMLNNIHHKNLTSAEDVKYGFKAPVSMLVLPLLVRQFESVKFLHVVRDGRDVSLGKNKSPVAKFYNSYYPDEKQISGNELGLDQANAEHAKAMQLWNDWNTQVLEWGQKNNDGEKFDYLVMRTEDLMDPARKFTSLMQLADFVGSPKSPAEICCLSRRPIVDLGQSNTNGNGKNNDSVKNGQKMTDLLRKREGIDVKLQLQEKHHHDHHHTIHDRINAVDRNNGNSDEYKPYHNEELSGFLKQGVINNNAMLEKMRVERPEMFAKMQEQQRLKREKDEEDRQNRFRKVAQRLHKHGKTQEHKGTTTTAVHKHTAGMPALHRQLSESNNNNNNNQTVVEEKDPMLEEVRDKKLKFAQKQLDLIQDEATRQKILDFMKIKNNAGRPLRQRVKVNAASRVNKRYGKWVDVLEKNPKLSDVLHELGADGLKAFGYEPRLPFQDRMNYGFRCDDSVVCAGDQTAKKA